MTLAPHVRSVNVGMPRTAAWADLGRTSIDKRPVVGSVVVTTLGLAGDQVSDTTHHGGIDQAVYAFAREDLDFWERELGRSIVDGQFGENLTTDGMDVNEALVGERWRVGTALFEVASVRIPCRDFTGWMGATGFDTPAWVKRFTSVHRPGPYLRVVEAGRLAAGDDLVVEHRPDHGVTVSTMFRALTTERTLLPLLLEVAGLVEEARLAAEKYVAQHT